MTVGRRDDVQDAQVSREGRMPGATAGRRAYRDVRHVTKRPTCLEGGPNGWHETKPTLSGNSEWLFSIRNDDLNTYETIPP